MFKKNATCNCSKSWTTSVTQILFQATTIMFSMSLRWVPAMNELLSVNLVHVMLGLGWQGRATPTGSCQFHVLTKFLCSAQMSNVGEIFQSRKVLTVTCRASKKDLRTRGNSAFLRAWDVSTWTHLTRFESDLLVWLSPLGRDTQSPVLPRQQTVSFY